MSLSQQAQSDLDTVISAVTETFGDEESLDMAGERPNTYFYELDLFDTEWAKALLGDAYEGIYDRLGDTVEELAHGADAMTVVYLPFEVETSNFKGSLYGPAEDVELHLLVLVDERFNALVEALEDDAREAFIDESMRD
jgi:hypothetical protein